ncbi:related to Peroxisome biogenesis factor 10 [Zygosaccharomyces bailii]|nr:related to Peroxisome biogenesis factor 10 [Zygosaccharomyces bailii]
MEKNVGNPEDVRKSTVEPSLLLPFADAPSIGMLENTKVQAHQKDLQIESILSGKIEEVVKNLKGQLYVNERPREISIAVKLLYLSLTTLIGNKTLGEEYVDLIYVNKKGNRLVQRYRKLLFILSYTLGPYLASRLLKRWNKEATNIEEDTNKHFSWKDISNTLLNIHLIIFYFKGAYYDVSKRVFGMRYAIGHKVEDEEGKFRKSSSDRYKILGYFLLAQGVFKGFPLALQQFKHLLGVTSNSLTGKPSGEDEKAAHELGVNGEIKGIPSEFQVDHVDLADPSQLPFIPPSSRKCILCLSEMMDPSCAPCGHLFCWSCIMNWCKEREECPLCRQRCLRQQILPLR